MPIFARTKITIEEDCMLPTPKLTITFSGPNPHKIYPKVMEILKSQMKIKAENIQEKDYSWDRSSTPEKFSAKIEAVKDFDKFTYMLMWIDFSGSIKPSKEFGKEGDLKLNIDGVIRTDYPQDTVWERSIIYEFFRAFYHKIFYQEKRYKYREMCRESMLTIQNEVKSFLNILLKE